MVGLFVRAVILACLSLTAFAQAEPAPVDSQELISRHHESLFDDLKKPYVGIAQGPEIVEFFDYGCSHCRKTHGEVKKLAKTTKVIMVEFPIMGPNSELASRLALAAQKQGKYEPIHDALMTLEEPLNDDTIAKLAKVHGLDLIKLNTDRNSLEVTTELLKNRQLAFSLGIMGTPAFVTKNQILSGSRTAEQLKKEIQTTVITLSI